LARNGYSQTGLWAPKSGTDFVHLEVTQSRDAAAQKNKNSRLSAAQVQPEDTAQQTTTP
jgi:hypothetical protein